MSEVKFEISEQKSTLKIIGDVFDLSAVQNLLKLLNELDDKPNLNHLKIIGNFNTRLLLDSIIKNKTLEELDKTLSLFQKITKKLETSKTTFESKINGIAKGPAMEIALLCNFLNVQEGSTFLFDQTDSKLMPFFGIIQRLTRLIGYENSLKIFLTEKKISFAEGVKLELFNNKIDNITKAKNKIFFWDQTFTNTFIYYNSRIHSTYQNQNPVYNAILSTIFESSVCNYEVGLSIEKRWLKWLLKKKLNF